MAGADFGVLRSNAAVRCQREAGFRRLSIPGPGVAQDELRNEVQGRGLGPAIVSGHFHEHITGLRLRVLDEHIEVAVVRESGRIVELILRGADAAAAILIDQIRVRKSRLRILIKHLQIRMRGRGVEIVVLLFDVLAVIALAIRQAEEPLLQDGVAAVPQGQ